MAEERLHEDLAARLLAWYDDTARVLPWRAPPGVTADPYAVWLSEIMLQQTTVAAVKSYFLKFLAAWPTVSALAAAPLDDVLRAWAGLGYYARARNLHACAKVVAGELRGRFPESEEALRQLPGIGPYTAAAVAAIAFGGRHAAVDGNVERVISRLYAIATPLPGSKPDIRVHAQALVAAARAGDFAQALMELGATVCTPKSPACQICPWAEHCVARDRGLAAELPRRKPKARLPTRCGTAFWIERDGLVLLRRRPERGLLGGMMEVPSSTWVATPPSHPERYAPLAARWKILPGVVLHTFTHFHLKLTAMAATQIDTGELRGDGDYRWVARDALGHEALPTVMRKVVALAMR